MEIAIAFYGKKAILKNEQELKYVQLDNYRENMEILIEKIKDEVKVANSSSQNKR